MNKPKPNSPVDEPITKQQHATQAYPKKTLIESLRVAESIKVNNAARPFNRITLAKSLDYSPSSSTFRALITASGKFGLTTGSYAAERIELTQLGLSIVMNKSEEEKKSSLLASLMSIPFYKKFFTDFKGNRIPSKELLTNTLVRDYAIPSEDAEECYGLLLRNAEELGILEEVKGTKYVSLEKIAIAPMEMAETNENLQENNPSNIDIFNNESANPSTALPDEIIVSPKNNKVFITHGSNINIVTQLKELLKFGKLEPIVAEEHTTTSIPVPHKVFSDMRSCSAAIIHVAGEDKMIDSEGKEHIVLNQNVLIEIGAAMALYDKNIILLVEKGTALPSNLQGLYRCDYEGSKLDYDSTMKLLKSFNEFELS